MSLLSFACLLPPPVTFLGVLAAFALNAAPPHLRGLHLHGRQLEEEQQRSCCLGQPYWMHGTTRLLRVNEHTQRGVPGNTLK